METKPNKVLSVKDYPFNEDIVISGISGRFPESDNMDEFAKNMYSGVDMVTCDDRRWPIDINDGLGARTGKIKSAEKFDSAFFSMLSYLSHSMDPISRIVLETTYEAFFDAGICPHSIRGSNTGVYFGINTIAQADGLPQDDFHDVFTKEAAFWVYGNSKVLYANRISFLFDFQGPSLVIDTACSASLVALATAVNDLRMGACDLAVVATGNMVPAPFGNSIYSCVGLLAKDGKCKVWDRQADGFVRSETIGTLILQRRSQAKRVYATVLHCKINSDGFKSVGLFAPYWLRQKDLMMQTYTEAGIDPNELAYFEAHGTGTNVGDPQEAKAISEAYCKDRKDPLLVGAVKSNLGHSEGSSGLNSISKVIIAYENKCIPANLHFTDPKPEIYAIVNKLIEPVVKNTPFNNGIVGLNSFGVGGVNAHVLLKSNDRELTPESFNICEPIPRLVLISGRTEEAMTHMFEFIQNNPEKTHRDFFALLNESMKTDWIETSSNFPYRGYMIIKPQPNNTEFRTIKGDFGEVKIPQYSYETKTFETGRKMPVWLVFSGMGSQWLTMAKGMMKLEPFANSIKRSAQVLAPFGIDLMDLLFKDDSSIWKSTVNPFVAITSMQIALYDIIKLLNFKVDGIIGHSFGEVACAYADGCLTLEQAVLTSYWRGKVVEQSSLPRGVLAAIGLSWEETKKRCPPGIVPACHNGSDSVTISGLYENTKKFVEQLQSENIFARLVAGGEYPYHSPHMNSVAPDLMNALEKIIPEPKKRSSKWISTSFPKSEWNGGRAAFASADYFTNNLVSPVLFNEGMQELPKEAITIEVAPHSLFDSIFKRCYQQHHYLGLMKRNEVDNLNFFLNSIGKLYSMGTNVDIETLYPRVEWPVARSTQSLSSLFMWDHQKSYHVKKYPEFHNFSTASDYYTRISVHETNWHFLRDHCVEGKVIFPATGYLYLVWRRFANQVGQPWSKTPIHFENVRFHRPTLVSETSDVKFTIRILQGSGEFLVFEGPNVVCTGKITLLDNDQNGLEMQDIIEQEVENDEQQRETSKFDYLTNKEIYKELRIRGYDYGNKFQGLLEARSDGHIGQVKWTGHFISFMDSMLHISLIALPLRALFVPIGFESVRIDPIALFGELERVKEEKREKKTEELKLKKEFLYFSDKIKENEYMEMNITQRVEAIVDDQNDNEESKADLPIQFYETAFMKVDDSKISKIPVVFDVNNRSIVTKGMEVKGMIPFNIPRKVEQKGLLLERYHHLAYIEDDIETLTSEQANEMKQYSDLCNELCRYLTLMPKAKPEPKQIDLSLAHFNLAKHYARKCEIQENNPYLIFMMLQELLGLKLKRKESDEEYFTINTCVEEDKMNPEGTALARELLSKWNLSADIVTLVQTHERLIRPLLDTVLENHNDRSNIRIIEINSSLYLHAGRVEHLIKSSFVGNMNVDYTYASSGQQTLTKEMNSLNFKSIEWKPTNNTFLDDINSIDLLIYRLTNTTMQNWEVKKQIDSFYDTLKENGFLLVLVREKLHPVEKVINGHFQQDEHNEIGSAANVQLFINAAKSASFGLVGKKVDLANSCSAYLFRKLKAVYEPTNFSVLKIVNYNFDEWVDQLKKAFAENQQNPQQCKTIWLVANDKFNGLVGMVNCLRLEPGGANVRCIFDLDGSLPDKVDFNRSPFNEIGYFDLVFNVFHQNKWGAYRYITLPQEHETVETEYAYMDVETRGDLSSFKWYESEQKHFQKMDPKDKIENMIMCDVYFSALNFKDVMLATGRIQPGPESAIFDCVIGLEFSGRRRDNGKRVMGMVPFKGFATTITSFENCLWDVPEQWTLEEAASIPVVYCTAYYALVVRGALKEGDKVLIHSAAGGVGQAAIRICQYNKCEIYVTVGNQDKRDYIKREFGISDENIFNSRDLSFERHIKERTKGMGVDIVLNSLAEEKLQASLRCLGLNGRFLEIGKYDMQMNRQIGMFCFLQNISFHGICLDSYFREGFDSPNLKRFMKRMTELLHEGIKQGVVRPIQRTSFAWNEVEQAFRYMSTGKHIGKVMIKMRDEEPGLVVAKPLSVRANRRTWFNPSKSYVIVGGLGGFGLELLYWMVMRGAKKFILSSRGGLKNSYQKLYFKRLKELSNYVSLFDIDVVISTSNVVTEEGTISLLNEATAKGPIGGIFNLALVLHDAYIENQTVESFKEVCDPKLNGLTHLDKISRTACPELEYFVCFSSLTSGRGNAGQTNYGFANSAMERICEQRVRDGLPGHSIQWGPIGDVGVVADFMGQEKNDDKEEMLKVLGGISLQRISSCLEVLDRLLQIQSPVLSSLVKSNLEENSKKSEDDVLEQLCAHLNVDKRSRDETISEAGLDSMTVVEIQQRLERDYDVMFTVADVKRITIGEIRDFRDGKRDALKTFSEDLKKARMKLSSIKFEIPNEPFTVINLLPKTEGANTAKPIFFLPPIEGIYESLKELISDLAKHRPVITLNWLRKMRELNSVKKVAEYFKGLLHKLEPKGEHEIVSHSFGSIVGIHMCRKMVPIKSLIVLDPMDASNFKEDFDRNTKLELVLSYLRNFMSERLIEKLRKEALSMKHEHESVQRIADVLKSHGNKAANGKDIEDIIKDSFERAEMVLKYQQKNIRKLKMFGRDATQKTLQKLMLHKITVNVTVIKRLLQESDMDMLNQILLTSYGINRQDFTGRFDIYQVIGAEDTFLTNHLPFILQKIKTKLEIIYE